jgi:DNA-directed RNA polymerase II subunit RPB1
VVRAVVKPSHCGEQPLASLRACLPHFTLAAAALDVQVIHDPEFFSSTVGTDDDYVCRRELIFSARAPEGASPFVLRLVLDKAQLDARHLTAGRVATILTHRVVQGTIVWSEEQMAECFVRVRPFMPHPSDIAACKRACEELATRLLREVTLCGLPGIHEVRTCKETLWVCPNEGGLVEEPVTVLEASGTNLLGMLGLPEVQMELTRSNDVGAVLGTLGIEAAAHVLFDEIATTLSGVYINERHIAILVNTMTCGGYLLPISRHGLNRIPDNGPLARASFEETIDTVFEAALFGDTDPALCATSRVMLGIRTRLGTGMCYIHSTNEHPSIPEEPDEDEDDDVVFTVLGSDTTALPLPPAGQATESPFVEGHLPVMVPCPAAGNGLPHSFLERTCSSSGGLSYAPSSPRRLKRGRYAPSSPRRIDM